MPAQHTSKRQREDSQPRQRSQHPPTKKPRHRDNGHKSNANSNSSSIVSHVPAPNITLPSTPPVLPPISPEYEALVFTHPGKTGKGQSSYDMINYDRLEFLGDAYIEIIASRLIFDTYPTAQPGALCRMRETMVKNETLSKYSLMYGFDNKLRITGCSPEFGRNWTKICGDVLEAYAAAVVLSDAANGLGLLEKWLKELWAPLLEDDAFGPSGGDLKAKEELAAKVLTPGIRVTYVEERPHIIHKGQGRETYFIGIYLDGWGWNNQHLGSGEGPSKVLAGQEAAAKALRNHPLIDEIIEKRNEFIAQKRASSDSKKDTDDAR